MWSTGKSKTNKFGNKRREIFRKFDRGRFSRSLRVYATTLKSLTNRYRIYSNTYPVKNVTSSNREKIDARRYTIIST